MITAEERNLKRSAKRLHVQPKTLRSSIEVLENALDTVLFEKNDSEWHLTETGKILFNGGKALLTHERETIDAIRKIKNTSNSILRIGNVGQLGHNFLPAFLRSCHKQFPEMTTEFVELDIIQEHAKALMNGEIDIGFIYDKELIQLKDKGISSVLLIDTHTTVVMKSGRGPVAKDRVSLKELEGYPLFALESPNAELHSITMKNIFERRGIKPGPVKIVSGFDTLMIMLAGGYGISLLPDILNLPRIKGITTFSLEDDGDDLRFQLYAIWKSPEMKTFADILCRSVNPM